MEKIKIDIDQTLIKVYNMIATWHNNESSPEEKKTELKYLSHEIIDTIITDCLQGTDAKTSFAVEKGEIKKKSLISKLFNK